MSKSEIEQLLLIAEPDNYMVFMFLRKRLGISDKEIAYELEISTRAMTERVTGRAEIKRETIMALKYLVSEKYGSI